ncbi:hypothetical protein [Gelidibacter sp.]|uniref:hypothetical protein n=1 Tax=Gelidibacter sp. TaxID=2018083 RepID=UPI00326521E0
MDIQLEKYKLLEWLIGLKDERIISKIIEVKNENDDSWSDEISEDEKIFIKAGLKDLENGNTFYHEQVMEEVSRTYGL